jgi:hypothetical protein
MVEWSAVSPKEECMNRKRGIVAAIAFVLLFGTAVGGVAQTQSAVPSSVTQSAGSVIDQILTFIDSASTYLGQGVVYILNLITGNRVSSTLEKPVGYLAFITVILLLFGLIDFARRIIWIGIIVGWVLLVVRIVLDALNL